MSVEYEEEAKPKAVKTEINSRKRRLITKDGHDAVQHQLLNQYANQNSIASSTPSTKQVSTIIIDDKSQDRELKNDVEEVKVSRNDETNKLDQFEIFGMFVANEMRGISNSTLQKKLKRKILECILEINDDQDNGNNQSTS